MDLAIVSCRDYTQTEKALREALDAIHGLDFVRPGMRIVLKVNLVAPMNPDTAATVHPSLVCALSGILREMGAEPVIGDSPGGIYSAPYLHHVYETTGMVQAEKCGAVLNQDFSVKEAEDPEAKQARHFSYTGYLDQADAIIDVCKLKTHGMMGMSCGVKNMFGAIPGTMKPEMHYRYPKVEDFADMLVDIYQHFRPSLVVCDGVLGMEGNGPTQGKPRQVGCLMAARNGHVLDLAAAQIIGMEPKEVPTLRAAMERGLVPESLDGMEMYGNPKDFAAPDYLRLPRPATTAFHLLGDSLAGKMADKVIHHVLTPFPKMERKTCVGCAKCAGICPAHAIRMENGWPKIDRRACIHCFCCQEFCPMGAMQVDRTWIARVARKV